MTNPHVAMLVQLTAPPKDRTVRKVTKEWFTSYRKAFPKAEKLRVVKYINFTTAGGERLIAHLRSRQGTDFVLSVDSYHLRCRLPYEGELTFLDTLS